jgi:hypothetical protein
MNIETTTVISGIEVVDSGKKIMGHRIFVNKNDEYSLNMYMVDSKGAVKATMRVLAGCGQNTGYVSDWSVENM